MHFFNGIDAYFLDSLVHNSRVPMPFYFRRCEHALPALAIFLVCVCVFLYALALYSTIVLLDFIFLSPFWLLVSLRVIRGGFKTCTFSRREVKLDVSFWPVTSVSFPSLLLLSLVISLQSL